MSTTTTLRILLVYWPMKSDMRWVCIMTSEVVGLLTPDTTVKVTYVPDLMGLWITAQDPKLTSGRHVANKTLRIFTTNSSIYTTEYFAWNKIVVGHIMF